MDQKEGPNYAGDRVQDTSIPITKREELRTEVNARFLFRRRANIGVPVKQRNRNYENFYDAINSGID